jgi:TatD DNase family protein
MIIDSHCHLNFPELIDDLDNVVKRAKDQNVEKIVHIAIKPEEYQFALDIVKKYPDVYAAIGIHPHEASQYLNYDINEMSEFLKNKKIIGIGECGLDFYYNHSDHKAQETIFQKQIELASEFDLPLIVHTRSAEDKTAGMLENAALKSNLKGVIHCFTGTYEFAKRMINIGFYISLSGVITFKKSEALRETVSKLPLDKLLVETDAPFLAPIPYRGKTNEPAYVKYTLEKLADIKQVPYNKAATAITENLSNLFGI